MAKVPASSSSETFLFESFLRRFGAGPSLILVGVALFILTRIVKWLPSR